MTRHVDAGEAAGDRYEFDLGYPTGAGARQAIEDAAFERAVTAYRVLVPDGVGRRHLQRQP